jgi:hypothetical protein
MTMKALCVIRAIDGARHALAEQADEQPINARSIAVSGLSPVAADRTAPLANPSLCAYTHKSWSSTLMVATSASPLLQAAAGGGALLFRQLFDAPTGTFTYLLADVPSGEGVLIDPVFEQHERDLSLIRELGIHLVACLDTHAHADHVTGSWLMHQDTGSAIALAAAARAENVTQPL